MTFLTSLKLNTKPIFQLFIKISAALFTVFGFVTTFLSLEDIGVTNVWIKILILVLIVIISLTVSTILILFFFKKKKIWSNGKNKVYVSYGDLLKYAFKINEKNKKIIVIPVNDTFETIIDDGGEGIINPLVSPNTMHGKWIKEFSNKFNTDQLELNNRIKNDLNLRKYEPIKVYKKEEKPRGNLEKYKLGTIAIIEGDSTIFYLIAISEFNEKNNAQSNKIIIREAVENMIEFYDENGQGMPLYMPLMGTGSSRAKLTHNQSLKIIKSGIFAYEEKVNGRINIVVFNKDKDKISIFK